MKNISTDAAGGEGKESLIICGKLGEIYKKNTLGARYIVAANKKNPAIWNDNDQALINDEWQ